MLNSSVWPFLSIAGGGSLSRQFPTSRQRRHAVGLGWGWNIMMQPPVMLSQGPWDRAVVIRDFRKMPLWSKTTSGEYLLGVGNVSPMDLVKMQILKNPN